MLVYHVVQIYGFPLRWTVFRNSALSGEFLMLGYFSVLLDLSGLVGAMGVN